MSSGGCHFECICFTRLKVFFLIFSFIKFSFEIFYSLWFLGYILLYLLLCGTICLKCLMWQWFYLCMEQNYFPLTYLYERFVSRNIQDNKFSAQILNAFAESPEALATSQKLSRNSEKLRNFTLL